MIGLKKKNGCLNACIHLNGLDACSNFEMQSDEDSSIQDHNGKNLYWSQFKLASLHQIISNVKHYGQLTAKEIAV